MKFKIFLPILLIFIFTGCRFFWEPVNTPQKSVPQPAKKPIKTAIKGVITELIYKDSKYCYTIVATDTSNLKLKNANFCTAKYHYNKGDLVYAAFVDQNLQGMLLISEARVKDRVSYRKKPSKNKIPPAKEINIKFY